MTAIRSSPKSGFRLSPVRSLEVDFVKKWRVISQPLKSAIKRELKTKKPRQAIEITLKRYKIRDRLQSLILDCVEQAYRKGRK